MNRSARASRSSAATRGLALLLIAAPGLTGASSLATPAVNVRNACRDGTLSAERGTDHSGRYSVIVRSGPLPIVLHQTTETAYRYCQQLALNLQKPPTDAALNTLSFPSIITLAATADQAGARDANNWKLALLGSGGRIYPRQSDLINGWSSDRQGFNSYSFDPADVQALKVRGPVTLLLSRGGRIERYRLP